MNLGHIAFWIFILLSWVTTAIGLHVFLSLPFAFLLSLGISILMAVLAPNLVPRWHRKIRLLLAWALYPPLTLTSIFFASAFYFQKISGQGLAGERAEQGELALLGTLNTLQDRYQTLSRGLDELAEYSRRQARLEEKQGGTCATSTGTGKGPIWAMRLWQADYFTDTVKEFKAIEQRLQNELQRLHQAVTQADPSERLRTLQRLIPALAQYNQRPEITHLLGEIQRQNQYQMEGYPRDPAYQYRNVPFGGYTCRDSRLAQRIDTLTEMGTPQVQLPQIEGYDAKDLRQNLALVIDLWLDILAGKNTTGVDLTSERILTLLMGVMVDFIILGLGFYLGLERRSHPVARRLTRGRIHQLAQRLEDITEQYPQVFPKDRLPSPDRHGADADLQRIQTVLDTISQPAGQDKIVCLPSNTQRILNSSRRKGLSDASERRLEAVIAVLETLSHHRLLGEPLRIPNRHTHYQGHDLETVAKWYGLDRRSIEAFSVYLLPPELMSEATSLLSQGQKLLPHHTNLRRRLQQQHPDYFEAEEHILEDGCQALSPSQQAEILLRRTENLTRIPLPQKDEKDDTTPPRYGHQAEITLYPRLFALDRCLETLLRDDDHGLHQDLTESRRARWAQFLFPYRRFILGPQSYAALQKLVQTKSEASQENDEFEDFEDDIPF